MFELLFTALAYAGEGTDHSHGPEFSGTQIVGSLIIVALAMGVMFFMNKKSK